MTNEEFIEAYGDRANMQVEGGRVVVGGYLYLSGCTGLTALPDNLSVGGSLDLSDCTGLTALPDNLSVGGYLNLIGCTGLTHWDNKPFNWRVIDGYSMLIKSTRQRDGYTIHKARWLYNIAPRKPLKSCYVVDRGDYAAHGDTLKDAMRDLRFKIAQAEFDPAELAETIRKRGTVERNDFRLITGACEVGLRMGMQEAGLDPDAEELPLSVVLEKAHGPFGDAFRKALR